VLKVLIDAYGVERALVTTVHAYTASQSLVDVATEKMHRGRAGSMNIIPTSTGADACTILVLPELKNRLLALALRVPVANVALIDISAELSDKEKLRSLTGDDINRVFMRAAEGSMKNIIQYSDEQLVSSDIIGNPHSAVIHGLATRVLQGNMINLFAWYDNEYGYACRCLDIAEKISGQALVPEPVV
jgi:glyceraldehyde-3-phosphate dehydrogenase type I